jgi:hypothetical protein
MAAAGIGCAGKAHLKDQETKYRFIELRAAGLSFARIAEELHVSKPTLIDWSRTYQFQIQNLRAVQLEALQEKYLKSHEQRLQSLGTQLQQMEQELATRKLSDIPTARLVTLMAALRREIARDTTGPVFSTPANEIPSDEKVYAAHDWRA